MPKSCPGQVQISSPFDLIGGLNTFRQISEEFHRGVERDVVLRPLFPKNMEALTEWLALYMGENLGATAAYTIKRGKQSLVCRHAHLSISTAEAERWLTIMLAAVDQVGIVDPERQRMREFFLETASTLTDPFLPLYKLPLDELRAKITADPTRLEQSSSGHSLLRDAVCRWDAPRVRLLLGWGANVRSREPLGHGLLYRAANSVGLGSKADGKEVVELLIQFGADVNLESGPGKSTPLHMAARRGHVFLAEELLKSGADIEARDSKGETPLRRAVNCGQESMVTYFLSQGANPLSQDRRGRTPVDAARHEGVREALAKAIKFANPIP